MIYIWGSLYSGKGLISEGFWVYKRHTSSEHQSIFHLQAYGLIFGVSYGGNFASAIEGFILGESYFLGKGALFPYLKVFFLPYQKTLSLLQLFRSQGCCRTRQSRIQ